MPAATPSKGSYRFGLFEADLASGELLRQGVRVRLQDQPFRVLVLLLERPGEIVTREELRQQLWPDGTFVDFDGSLNAILKKLRAAIDDDSDNPRFIETIPRRGYRFIAPVSVEVGKFAGSPSPKLVDQPVSEVARATTVLKTTASNRRWPRRQLYFGSALLVAVGAVWLLWQEKQPIRMPSQASAQVPVRESVAVLGFQNASGRRDDDWLSTSVSEMLSTELAMGDKLRVVPGEEVANLRISSPWPQTSTLGRETTNRVGTALNSDLLVLGSYTSIGKADHSQLRFDVRLQDARTGEVLSQIARTGNVNDLFQFTSEIGARLRQRLGVPEIKESEQAGVLASLPEDREGARFYALGIAKLQEFDVVAAKDLLEQAVKADPKFSLAHLMLARAWGQLGYEQNRKEEAKKALDLSVDLPRTERMQVEGDYYETVPDHEKAASAYRALFELFPDNVEYGLQLAAAQKAAGHDSQAGQTIAQLRRLPPPASDDPRIDMEDVTTPNNIPAALALERSAMRKADAQGKKMLYAQAEKLECMDMIYSSQVEAQPACEDAYNRFWAAGNRLAAADTVRLMADRQGGLGHLDQAILTYQRALKILEPLGEHEKTGAILNNMAIAFTNQGKLDRGEELYRQAKFHFEQAGDKHNTGTAIGNIADILYLRGNLPGAEKLYSETMEIESALDRNESAYSTYRLADLKLTEGKVEEAHKLAQQAIDSLRPIQGVYQYLTSAMSVLGDVLKAEGNSEAARQQYEASLEIANKTGDPDYAAEAQEELADLALDEGHADQAEPLLRATIAQFEKDKSDPDNTSAYTDLSRALLMQEKLQDARTAIQHAAELSRTSPNPALKLPIAIQTARMMLAGLRQNERGHPSLAAVRQQLRSASDDARKLGYYDQECEARLALGELELKANPQVGRSLLTQLAAEAHGHGMELVARKATALAGSVNVKATAVLEPRKRRVRQNQSPVPRATMGDSGLSVESSTPVNASFRTSM